MLFRTGISLILVVLFAVSCGGQTAVAFNVNWYPTPPFPFNNIVGYPNCEVTTGIVIADFNRDGIPDVAYSYPSCGYSVSPGGGGVIAKLGMGSGNLGADIYTNWGAESVTEIGTADVNSDGWLDLVVRDAADACLTFIQGNGDGTFQPFSAVVCGGGTSFTLGDFNHDGKIDLADVGCCSLNIYLGDGAWNFTQVQTIQLAGPSSGLQSADINGDGNLDLIYVRTNYDSATDQYSGVGTIRWGRGDGTFATSNATYLKPNITNPLDAVTVADFNNDGRLDVALLAGRPCHPGCGSATLDTVWMYKNSGARSFTLASQTKFAQHAGTITAADINGDLNQDLIYYNPFAMGIYPQLRPSGGFQYALGLGKGTLGTQGILPDNGWDVAAAFRDMNGDSRADYAVIDWGSNQLGIGIQTGGYKNCPPPSSANLAARICGIKDGTTLASPVLVRASGNSPAGVNQLQVWIDGKKRYVKWGDQLARRFTLSSGKHRIAVAATDKFVGIAKTVVNVNVP
jgi:FG-GAP-like repeat